MAKFGATVRKLREAEGISLRRFAESIGKSPTYVSKFERDDFPPPGVETIRSMARVLKQDEDWLLGLAGKVASDLPDIVQERPQLMAQFLRTAGRLTDEDVQKILKQMEKMERMEKAK